MLRELRKGGYIVKNGDALSSCRQIRNNRKPGFQPITITFKEAIIADDVREAAERVGILNERLAKPDDKAKDNIGHLRRSLSEKERKKIRRRAAFNDSEQGKALKEIRKREAESTTNESEWLKVDLEEDKIVDTVGTKETTETDEVKATKAAQENRRKEAVRKAAEAAKALKLKLTTQTGTKAHALAPLYTSEFAKELLLSKTNPTNPTDAQFLTEDLETHMDFIIKELTKNDIKNRKLAASASKEPNSNVP